MSTNMADIVARLTIVEDKLQQVDKKCEVFQTSVQELIEHARLNAEAIIEHIAQLDTEKAEIINEYKVALNMLYSKTKQELDDLLNEKRNTIL